MTAAVASAWGKPGAWALDSEEHEAELLQPQNDENINKKNHAGGGDTVDFASLAAAAATKSNKKKSPADNVESGPAKEAEDLQV